MRTRSVLDILERTAARLPDKVYMKDEWETITFAQCQERALQLGGALHVMLNGARRRPIILFVDKSCACVVSMLGVLYSGNFYIPMDIKMPFVRLESILRTMENATIITTQKSQTLLRKIGYLGKILLYEELLSKFLDEKVQEIVKENKESVVDVDLMYVMFTSGSTGTPKGVAVMHRSVVDYLEMSTSEMGIEENSILGSQAPFYSDTSLKDIYMTMQAGASACLIPQRLFMTPKKLLQYLDEQKITHLMWVPTVYRLISQFDALKMIRPEYLKRCVFSGEVMPVPVYQYWKEHFPDVEFVQQYGPTEITGVCTSYKVDSDYGVDETIPIGMPLPNTGILLLDENDHEVPLSDISTMGEICVYGTCLSAGYYNDMDKTKEVFVQNPTVVGIPSLMYRTGDLARYDANGNLVFISRKDYQVKHGGRRIELGEVETAFQSVSGIKAVCCVHNKTEDKLVLYYVGDIPEDKLSLEVRNMLPKYMIPAKYHRLDRLPMLPNGKTDRKALNDLENA